MEPATGTSRKAKPTRRLKLSWRYWKTPVLFGVGLCALQILVAMVRFGGGEGWNPAILFEIPKLGEIWERSALGGRALCIRH